MYLKFWYLLFSQARNAQVLAAGAGSSEHICQGEHGQEGETLQLFFFFNGACFVGKPGHLGG